MMQVSSKLSDFSLLGVDDNFHSSNDLNKDCLAIIFTCNHCPYARAYINRISNLVNKYASSCDVVCISSNDAINYPADSFENMKDMAKHLGVGGLYLYDESQEVAKAYNAGRTPEVYLFNKERTLVYKGAFDDNWEKESDVKQHYLIDAVEETLKNKDVTTKETQAVGCSIKWKA